MGDAEQVVVKVVGQIAQIPAAEWNACAGPENPFVTHAFLLALESSGSASPATGWAPRHLTIEDETGCLLGAMPLYLKDNSFGEYVFDHAWAEAFQRAGGQYYPKLQAAVPFTPVTGPRLLCRPGRDRDFIDNALLGAASRLAEDFKASSLHITFPTQEEWQRLGKSGFLLRMDQQFHWHNDGYENFNEFLDCLSSRKRKAIRRERRAVVESGLAIERRTGSEICAQDWDAFFAFYLDTGQRKWGRPYLNRAFFEQIAETMADQVMLAMCRRDGRPIAGALNIIGQDTLFGRYWGCLEDHRFLHFELCYYQAMDFAIERGLARVEAGAQGMHKLSRGYLPTPTYSAHWIMDPGLSDAVAQFLDQEKRMVEADLDALGGHSPFKS